MTSDQCEGISLLAFHLFPLSGSVREERQAELYSQVYYCEF